MVVSEAVGASARSGSDRGEVDVGAEPKTRCQCSFNVVIDVKASTITDLYNNTLLLKKNTRHHVHRHCRDHWQYVFFQATLTSHNRTLR
jgi:hypothetical protein